MRALAWCAGLPGPYLRKRLARVFALRELRANTKRTRIVRCNLALAGVADPALEQRTLEHTAVTLLESLRFWTRSRATNLAAVVKVENAELLNDAKALGGVLLIAPHYGNWELLVQWLATQGPLSLLYTRGASPALDTFLRLARERHGVRAVPADAHGMKPLLKALQRGELVGITPDQTPDGAGGLWSSFFGQPALTMTLIHRLAERSGAQLLLAAAERLPDGTFTIVLAPLPAGMTSDTLQTGIDAMNLAIEQFVRRDLAQYQWTYKRFKGHRPDGELINPYWPECY